MPRTTRYISSYNPPHFAQSNVGAYKRKLNMKRTLTLSVLTALLGGCAIVPLGYYGDGYSRGHGYYRGDGYRQDNGYYRGYGQRGYGYQDRGR